MGPIFGNIQGSGFTHAEKPKINPINPQKILKKLMNPKYLIIPQNNPMNPKKSHKIPKISINLINHVTFKSLKKTKTKSFKLIP